MTSKEMVDKLNREMLDRLKEEGSLLGSRGEIIEAEHLQEDANIVLYRLLDGTIRVAQVQWYVNRAKRPQAVIYLKDFKEMDDAETLYLNLLDGHMAFGMVFKLSRGSGLRFVRMID